MIDFWNVLTCLCLFAVRWETSWYLKPPVINVYSLSLFLSLSIIWSIDIHLLALACRVVSKTSSVYIQRPAFETTGTTTPVSELEITSSTSSH